jgi:hypothetical protein
MNATHPAFKSKLLEPDSSPIAVPQWLKLLAYFFAIVMARELPGMRP